VDIGNALIAARTNQSFPGTSMRTGFGETGGDGSKMIIMILLLGLALVTSQHSGRNTWLMYHVLVCSSSPYSFLLLILFAPVQYALRFALIL